MNLISPNPGQSFAPGTDIEFLWSDIPDADWYYFRLDYRYHDSYGEYGITRWSSLQMDTTITISGGVILYNGDLSVYLEAGTGPSPETDRGNITGGAIKGVVNSSSLMGAGFFIGTGLSPQEVIPDDHTTQARDALLLESLKELFLK